MFRTPFLHQPCLLCLAPTCGCVCELCRNSYKRTLGACRQCGLATDSDTGACGDCLQHPKPFAKTVCAFSYAEPLNHLIHLYKEKMPAMLLDEFVGELLPALRHSYAGEAWPDGLVPVPSHWRKRLARGYNPAACLAKALAGALQLTALNACTATLAKPAQKSLSRKARMANLTGAFKIAGAGADPLRGRHLALVDDVITTGTTVLLLSQLLLAAGAARVDVWAIARTPRPADI